MTTGLVIIPDGAFLFAASELREAFMAQFRAHFGTSWQAMTTPTALHYAYDMPNQAAMGSGVWLFERASTNLQNAPLRYPVPITGIIIPCYTYPVDDEAPYRENRQSFITEAVYHAAAHHRVPILLVVVDDPNDPLHLTDPADRWWVDAKARAFLDETDALAPDVQTLVVPQGVNPVPAIAAHFGLTLSPSVAAPPHPHLPWLSVMPCNLGIERHAPERFATAFITQWLATRPTAPLHVWLDMVPTHPLDPRQIAPDTLAADERWQISKPHVTYVRTADYRSYVSHIEPAHHLYLELDGMVYDGVLAFDAPRPLAAYQAALNSTWRQRVTIAPTLSVTEALALLDSHYQPALHLNRETVSQSKPNYHMVEVSDIAFDVEVVLTFARPLNHEEQTAALGIVEDTLAKIMRSPHLLITGKQQVVEVSEHHLRMVMRHPTRKAPDYPPEQRDLDSHVRGAALLHVFWLIIIFLSERFPVQHPFPPFWFDDPAVRQEGLDEYPLA